MKQPTLSLIIPAYNEEKYIAQCLHYALKHSNGLLHEIIVINNASTDKTHEVVARFPNVRIVHEPNKGLTHARQRGFKEAQGEILAYIDADTQMPERWCERVLNEFNKSEKTVCVSGAYVYHDVSLFKKIGNTLYWYLIAVPMYTLVGYMAVGGNFAIKKDTLHKMNGFDTSIHFYGEDTNIARRASQFGNVIFKPSLYMYTSGRRFQGQGYFKTALLYMLNFVSEAFFRKPFSKEYKDIR